MLFIPTLILISLFAFIISVNAPGDPLDTVLNSSSINKEQGQSMNKDQVNQRAFWNKKLGLDLPLFYLGIKSYASPDTLYRIVDKSERTALERWIWEYGNWEFIQKYYLSQDTLSKDLITLESNYHLPFIDDTININYDKEFKSSLNNIEGNLQSLKSCYEELSINKNIAELDSFFHKYDRLPDTIITHFENFKSNYSSIKKHPSVWKNYLPSITFNGLQNQYHIWVFGNESIGSKGLIKGDFGTSYITRQPVSEIIYNRMGWTLFFSLTSVFLAYLISIPIGIKAAARKGKRFDRISSSILFILFSMPGYWMATLLLMTFANPDVFKVFKASGVKPIEGFAIGMNLLDKICVTIPYLVLPTICYTYSSLAFISRNMRASMIETLSMDYIRTAKAKGLPESLIVYKHALRNSLFPIINLFATLLPAVISGSIILESIFSIPGMGTETLAAIDSKNYPMIVAIFTLTGLLTLTGFLISDILFKISDPRIDFSK